MLVLNLPGLRVWAIQSWRKAGFSRTQKAPSLLNMAGRTEGRNQADSSGTGNGCFAETCRVLCRGVTGVGGHIAANGLEFLVITHVPHPWSIHGRRLHRSSCCCSAFPNSECHTAEGSRRYPEQKLQAVRTRHVAAPVEACLCCVSESTATVTPTAFLGAQLQCLGSVSTR